MEIKKWLGSPKYYTHPGDLLKNGGLFSARIIKIKKQKHDISGSLGTNQPGFLSINFKIFSSITEVKKWVPRVPLKKNSFPKFNIAPEKWWLEDYFPFGMVYFQGLC